MKKIFLAIILAISICQISNAQTTWDEYNYGTKGYKEVLENGTNPKIGYRVVEIINKQITWSNNDYSTAWLKALYRTSTNKIVAYIVVYQLRDKSANRDYFCIPNPNSDNDIMTTYLHSLGVGSAVDVKDIYRLTTLMYAVSLGLKW